MSATAGAMAAVLVTSRISACAPAPSASNFCLSASLRTVPATIWPSLNAASANARPKPEETPVMRNVFAKGRCLFELDCRLHIVGLIDAIIGIEWHDLMQDIAQ